MPPKRVSLFINSRAGRGLRAARIEQVVERWKQAGIVTEVRRARCAGAIRVWAQHDPLQTCDGLVVYGGDGTVRVVVAGLLARGDQRRPPLGILPGGTGNSLRMHLGGEDWSHAVEAIARGSTAPLDVARVVLDGETTYSVNLVGWSSAAAIGALAERWRLLGPARYSLAALWQIARARPEHLVLSTDGVRIEDDFLLVLACNTRYGGRRMLLAPQARIDDGLLDLVLVRRASRRQMLHLFRHIHRGTHVHLPFVECQTVRQLTVEQGRKGWITIDGEMHASQSATIDVLPGALRLFA